MTTAPPEGTLPVTGARTELLVPLGWMLVAAGCSLFGLARRRQPPARVHA